MSQMLMAAGLDPEVCTIFVQSHVREHTECAWLLECTVSFGELSRMTQFKDKSGQQEFISAGLFTYPALQAADILLYDADEVPVGAPTRSQHIELTRDIAERFNSRLRRHVQAARAAVIPAAGARVMDLQSPTNKMSKSLDSPRGTVDLLDDPASHHPQDQVRRDRQRGRGPLRRSEPSPGVSNLLSILGAATGRTPEEAAAGLHDVRAAQGRHRRRGGRVAAPRSRPASPNWRPTRPRRRGC